MSAHAIVDRREPIVRPVAPLSGIDFRDLEAIVAGCRPLFDRMRDARVVVTGATGWFGTWLLDALVASNRADALGLRIVAVSRRPQAFRLRFPALHDASEIEWVRADVRDGRLPIAGRVTHVLHAAADSHAAHDDGALYDTIVTGALNAIALSFEHRARLLVVGSGAVYGRQPASVERLDETFEPDTTAGAAGDAYARGKREAERLALTAAADGLDVTIARCFAFLGPHMPFDAHFAIGNFIRDALEAPTVDVAGDGRPLRSYLYMTDLVEWLLTMLVSDRGGIYNVGSPEAIAIAGLARRCVDVAGVSKPVRIHGDGAGGRDYVPDVSRAMGVHGLRVRVPLDDAIARTIRWRRTYGGKGPSRASRDGTPGNRSMEAVR